MKYNIVLFTLEHCDHCSKLKTMLDDNNIKFMDIDVEKNRQIWEQIINQTGLDRIPSVFLKEENSNSGQIYVPGRDYQSFDEIINIIKTIYF